MVATTYSTTFESKTVTATTGGASADIVYTVPASHDATIDYLGVANGGNSSSKITVEIFHADDTSYHYLTNLHSIAGHDTYHLLNADRIHLHAGDKIVVSKDAGTFDVSVSAREFFNPTR